MIDQAERDFRDGHAMNCECSAYYHVSPVVSSSDEPMAVPPSFPSACPGPSLDATPPCRASPQARP